MNNFNNPKLAPFKCSVLQNFPFIEYDFDALTNWQLFCKIGEKINEIINFINDDYEEKMNEFFNKKFNEIMINSMYESETETLVLYLDESEVQ